MRGYKDNRRARIDTGIRVGLHGGLVARGDEGTLVTNYLRSRSSSFMSNVARRLMLSGVIRNSIPSIPLSSLSRLSRLSSLPSNSLR